MDIPWALKITRVENGYLLEWAEKVRCAVLQKAENVIFNHQQVIEETNDPLKDHEELLWEVMNFFDFGGSKHDSERLRIIREKNAG